MKNAEIARMDKLTDGQFIAEQFAPDEHGSCLIDAEDYRLSQMERDFIEEDFYPAESSEIKVLRAKVSYILRREAKIARPLPDQTARLQSLRVENCDDCGADFVPF